MKIRIKGNSIRYRLVKSEVRQLAEQGYVEERTEFLTTTFIYRLEAKEGISELDADFTGNQITLYIPETDAKSWNSTDKISFKSIKVHGEKSLSLLLEKDFVCLDHTDEDQSDNYANPNKTC